MDQGVDTAVWFEILLLLLLLPHLRSIAPANYPMEQIFGDTKPTPPSDPSQHSQWTVYD